MKNISINIFLIFFSLFSISIIAQNETSTSLHKLQQKFNSLKDISADFVQSVNGQKNLTGKVFLKKENKIRLELKNLVLISNGKTTWNYNKKEKKVIISDYDDSDPSLFSLENIVDVLPSKCNVKNEDNNIINLTPKKDEKLNFSSVNIYVNPEDLIKSLLITTTEGKMIKIEFSEYKLNEKLPDSLFSLTPPKGSKVIDLR